MASLRMLHPTCLLALTLVLSGCGGGAGSEGGDRGSATLRGNISKRSVTLEEAEPPPAVARQRHIWAPSAAPANGIGLVRIRAVAAGVDTVTDQGGFFVLDNIPTGLETLIFQARNATFTLEVIVPVDATVELHDIVLAKSRARPANIEIKVRGDLASLLHDGDFEGGRQIAFEMASTEWIPMERGTQASVNGDRNYTPDLKMIEFSGPRSW